MTESANEIIAKCGACGFQLLKPFSSFEIVDDPLCPQCGHALTDFDAVHVPLEDLTLSHLLRSGWQIDRVPRDFVAGILEKAFMQGLASVDIRVTFNNQYEDEIMVEVLSLT